MNKSLSNRKHDLRIAGRLKRLEKYEASNVKCEHLCEKCGFVWDVRPNSLYNGSGCPQCGRKRRGALFDWEVIEIYKMLRENAFISEIAKKYGVTRDTISKIRKGKTHRKLWEIEMEENGSFQIGEIMYLLGSD